ncbi:MAG: hypothetical protein R2724_07375 [Bryobacterales bacterium]
MGFCAALALAVAALASEEEGKIVRPVEGAAIAAGPIDVAAKAPPGGRIELRWQGGRSLRGRRAVPGRTAR